MKSKKLWALLFGVVFLLGTISLKPPENKKPTNNQLQPWKQGYLDIHHINTGHGDAAFFIFPDGTTMLFDAGDMDDELFNDKWSPLRATSIHPSDSLNAGGWIAHYIRQVMPRERAPQIDYAVISHFHSDHYGNVKSTSASPVEHPYKLTGITEVGHQIPIGVLIDRNYPNYDYPVDLRAQYQSNATFQNYLSFIDYHSQNGQLATASLVPGSSKQITLDHAPEKYPNFLVQNVKANGVIWTGQGEETFEYFLADSVIDENGGFNENPLSLALRISYGSFDYFTGGDMTGMQGYGQPWWFDVETPVAKVVGEVEVTTMNHHGNRDATNWNFLKSLNPRVVLQQSWCSDHPGQEVFHRIQSLELNHRDQVDIFATNIHPQTKGTYGPWFTKAYKSMEGHILVRVLPGGNEFYVMVLDDEDPEAPIKSTHGPYYCN